VFWNENLVSLKKNNIKQLFNLKREAELYSEQRKSSKEKKSLVPTERRNL